MEYDPTDTESFSDEDLYRFRVFDLLQRAKKDAGLAMKRIVDLHAQRSENSEQESMRLAQLAHAKRQLEYYQMHTQNQLAIWRTLNP